VAKKTAKHPSVEFTVQVVETKTNNLHPKPESTPAKTPAAGMAFRKLVLAKKGHKV
jgi:hypothetical protein